MSQCRTEVWAAKARLRTITAPTEAETALGLLARQHRLLLAAAMAAGAFILFRKRGLAAAMAAGGFLARSQAVRRLATQWLLSQALARRDRSAGSSA